MGAIKAEGIKNQLGRPDIDRLTVLVREAAQNSWDARMKGEELRFELDLVSLDGPRHEAWRRILAPGAPGAGHAGLPLKETLNSEDLNLLIVSDYGTEGLGGPTRADQARQDAPHDYVSFILNVGDPRDTQLGGGTYGFGKAVFYLTSETSAIVVYTRCRDENGQPESRLIGAGLGEAFETTEGAYTGRHWFGLPERDNVEPIRGTEADSIAAQLGMPRRGETDTGTSIAIIAPRLDDRTLDEAARVLADSLLWHLWPKMLPETNPSMRFAVRQDGHHVTLGAPSAHPLIREFAGALLDLDHHGTQVRYKGRDVGKILLRTHFSPPPVIDEVGHEAGLGDGVRHCCLMRSPELVVEYRAGPPQPDQRVWYAGVFKVGDAFDAAFAEAEPPTHDGWIAAQLKQPERNLVQLVVTKIDKELREHAAPKAVDEPLSTQSAGFAAMSQMLGQLLAPAAGYAAGPTVGSTARPGGAKKCVTNLGDPTWALLDGEPVLVQRFKVDAKRAVTIDATVSVRLWGAGSESEAPVGATVPELLGWRAPDGTLHGGGRLALQPHEGGEWEALVRSPYDTATRIMVREAKESIDG